jgi:hypothetical protein
MTAVDSSALFMRSTHMTPADEEKTPMSGASRSALWLIRLQCSCHPRETGARTDESCMKHESPNNHAVNCITLR